MQDAALTYNIIYNSYRTYIYIQRFGLAAYARLQWSPFFELRLGRSASGHKTQCLKKFRNFASIFVIRATHASYYHAAM